MLENCIFWWGEGTPHIRRQHFVLLLQVVRTYYPPGTILPVMVEDAAVAQLPNKHKNLPLVGSP